MINSSVIYHVKLIKTRATKNLELKDELKSHESKRKYGRLA